MLDPIECIWCGDEHSELRWTGYDMRMNDAQPCCEACFREDVQTEDGPDWDALAIAQKARPVKVGTMERTK